MSSRATAWVWRQSQSVGLGRLVMLAVAESCNENGDSAPLTVESLGRRANASPSAVGAALGRLKKTGELAVSRRTSDGHITCHLPKLGQDQPPLLVVPPGDEDALDSVPASDVMLVFTTWLDSTERHGGQAKLGSRRDRRIRWALKHYPIQDVLDAVQGWKNSTFHTGDNPAGKVYCEIELLLRNEEKLEMFRDLHREGPSHNWRAPRTNVTTDRSPERAGLVDASTLFGQQRHG